MKDAVAVTTGLPTLQRGKLQWARLEPGEPSSRLPTLQRGNSVGARLEPGEPCGESSDNELKWHDRGYMPHVDGTQLIQHVSYHLADSLPKEALERMAEELKSLPPALRDAEKEKRIASYLDAGKGSCILQVPELAEMVQNAFLIFHEKRYELHAWCVMPNHVHVLFQPLKGWSMSKIVASWKSYTGRRISEYRKEAELAELQPGPTSVWHREYWDRYIRDHAHYVNVRNYIHLNPVKAGLVTKPEEWRWSSAYEPRLEFGEPSNTAGLEPGEPS